MIVSVEDLKLLIGKKTTEDDELLEMILETVQSRCETETGFLFDYVSETTMHVSGDGKLTAVYLNHPTIYETADTSIASITVWDDADLVFGDDTKLVRDDDYTVIFGTNIVKKLFAPFYPGVENIKVKYTGGYKVVGGTSGPDAPGDLKLAIMAQAAHVYQRRSKLGATGESVAGQNITYSKSFELLPDVKETLKKYMNTGRLLS